MKLKLDVNKLKPFVNAMNLCFSAIAEEYKSGIGKTTQNGKHFAVWDKRFDVLREEIEKQEGFDCVAVKRGRLWEFLALIDVKSKCLYIFFTDERLTAILKDSNYYKHYLNSLLYINHDLDTEGEHQVVLFENKELEELRLEDSKRMLKDKFNLIGRVIPITLTYKSGELIKSEARLLNGNSEILDVQDLSSIIYSNFDKNAAIYDAGVSPITKLKSGVSKKNEKIVSTKENEETSKKD